MKCSSFFISALSALSALSCIVPTLGDRTVIIGDSMYWSGMLFFGGQPSPLSKWLETWSGHPIENHALVGASLEEGWIKSIRTQYLELNKQPPITTLIMDGGGNDVISHRQACEKMTGECTDTIDKSVGIAQEIWSKAAADGIQNILYLGFYNLPGLEAAAAIADPKMEQACAQAPVRCWFIDPRYNATTGQGLPVPGMLGPDHLHPTPEGYKVLAQMIWDVKEANNIPV